MGNFGVAFAGPAAPTAELELCTMGAIGFGFGGILLLLRLRLSIDAC